MSDRCPAVRAAVLALGVAILTMAVITGYGPTSPVAAPPSGTQHPDLAEMGDDIPCTECHGDLLAGEFVHPPAAAEACESCHEFAGEGDDRTVSLSMPAEELCTICHENPSEVETAASQHPPVQAGECTFCHTPHSSDQEKLLLAEPNEVCLQCHVDQEEQMSLPQVHGVINTLGCPVCHDPHASKELRLLRGSGNQLCLECHLARLVDQPLDPNGQVALFSSRSVGAALFNAIPKVVLRQNGVGHPVARHPVKAESNPLSPEDGFGCTSCHLPHGSERRKLLVGDQTGSFCQQCHNK